MWLRLRQVALVATELERVERTLTQALGLKPCFRDPSVGEFGLHNVLFPIGNQFLEVVAPTRPGTAAGRYLERRRGDGGYMVITQCDDHAPRRARVEALGVRIAHQFEIDNFINMQLHPRDTGGSFFEIDQQLGPDSGAVDGPWAPAGPDWRECRNTDLIEGIRAVEIQSDDPLLLAEKWAEIAEIDLERQDQGFVLPLENADIRFVRANDGRPEGLAGIDVVAGKDGGLAARLAELGESLPDGCYLLAGMRWRPV